MRGNDSIRFAVYEPFGARLDLYPEGVKCDMSFVYGSPGDTVLNLSLNNRSHGSQYLDIPHEVAIEVNGVEIPDARFLMLKATSDLAEQKEKEVSLLGYNYDFLLQKAKVTRDGASTAPDRVFTDSSPGRIMRVLVGEAKTRGWGEGVYVDFNPSGTADPIGEDTYGKTWTTIIDEIHFEYGLDLLSVLRHFVDRGLCDAGWQGRKMQMFSPNSVDYQNKETTLVLGQDISDSPIDSSWLEYCSAVWVYGKELVSGQGPDQHQRTRTVGLDGVLPPWGRWETTVSESSTTGTGVLNWLGDRQLDKDMRRKHQYTVGLKFAEKSPLPFVNYKHGDWVYLGVKTPPEYLRIRQITLTLDETGGWAGNLVMNDRFLENDLKIIRKVRGITGGNDVVSGV